MLVPAPIGWYTTHVEPFRLHTDTVAVTVPNRAGTSHLRIGVLSDLQVSHVGRYERAAVDRLLSTRPDLILIPGDLFQGSDANFERTLPALRNLFSEVRARGGVFAVRGDVDTGDRADRVFAGTGIRIVDDEVIALRVRDRQLLLGGNRLDYTTESAVAVRDHLARDPDRAGERPTVPRNVARGGLHEVNRNKIVVSPGVGLERSQAPQVRFLRPPALVIVDIDDASR